MNFMKSAFRYMVGTSKDRPHSVQPQPDQPKHVLRIASVLDPATRITAIGWIISKDGRELTRGTTTINSHNDKNIGLYRAFHHGLEYARFNNIRNISVETSNPHFMLSSDKESNRLSKKMFKQLRTQLVIYIPKHFSKIHYITLIEEPEDVVSYIMDYLSEFDEEFKDEQLVEVR